MAKLILKSKHRVMCGDSCKVEDVERLIGSERADMVFTDPPYNVNYGATMKDNLRGTTRAGSQPGRIIKNDNLGSAFEQFLTDAIGNMLAFCDGAVYICMSSSELHTLERSFKNSGGHWSTFIIWAKNTFTIGMADYQRQYEAILYGWREGGKHFWCGARDQGDIWNVAKPRVNDLHPTMKPVELVERAIKNSSIGGQIVLDLFGGSGSTLIACEKTGRRSFSMELDELYVDVIVKRWEDFTGQKAIRAGC